MYRPGDALRFPGDCGSQVSKQSVHEGGLLELRFGRLYSREDIAVLISVRGRVDPWAIAGPEGMKNCNDITRYLPSCKAVHFLHINNEYNITKSCVCVCVCVFYKTRFITFVIDTSNLVNRSSSFPQCTEELSFFLCVVQPIVLYCVVQPINSVGVLIGQGPE